MLYITWQVEDGVFLKVGTASDFTQENTSDSIFLEQDMKP